MSTQESAQEQSPSQAPRQASPHDVIGVGVAFSAAGLYFMLGAAGYVPMPEGNNNPIRPPGRVSLSARSTNS